MMFFFTPSHHQNIPTERERECIDTEKHTEGETDTQRHISFLYTPTYKIPHTYSNILSHTCTRKHAHGSPQPSDAIFNRSVTISPIVREINVNDRTNMVHYDWLIMAGIVDIREQMWAP